MLTRAHSSKQLTRVFIFGLGVCLIFLLFFIGFMRAFLQDYTVRKEISSLEREKAQLEHNKLLLLERLQEIKSDSFAEKEARLKFGLQKPGESVIILNMGSNTLNSDEATTTARAKQWGNSNASHWWRYFFKS